MYVQQEDGLYVLYGDQAARVVDEERVAVEAVDQLAERFYRESRADEAPWRMS